MFFNKASIKSLTLVVGFSIAALTQSAQAQTAVQYGQAQAQPNAAASAQYQYRPVLKKFNGSQNYMYETQALKSPVQMPNVPEYSGRQPSQFESGLTYPKLRTGQCILQRYLARENNYEVMKSYRNSLIQNGWQINDQQTNCKQMTASKKREGLYCTFCVFPSTKPGFRTSYEIKYLSTGMVTRS